ncbi:MAG TPA: DUF255 domain-containing protein, partial [Polyangiaceae bacterium]|nr:DUF255 domain-containing protein [Polyangiaceae bacterium]
REERPDLDAAYMAAVQAMIGSGGWPLTVFLTPQLRPFYGGTYFPHDRFLKTIQAVAEQFQNARQKLESQAALVAAHIAEAAPNVASPALDDAAVQAQVRVALEAMDTKWGGFRGQTKFPTPIRWTFLLDAYRKWGQPDVARALRRTLDAMAEGGLHDAIGGGFFRYATEPTWAIPHFEKMLYDNAQLASLYLQAAAVFGEPRYRAIGLDTLDFLLQEMLTPEQAFGASFDADAAGREGTTYLFTLADFTSLFAQSACRDAARLLGVTDKPNFAGASVPALQLSTPADAALWNRCRAPLLEARRKRPQPAFDAKLVTAWNGLAIAALARGYRASGQMRYREAAEHAASAIWRLAHDESGALTRSARGNGTAAPAILDDYAFLASGYAELFQANADLEALQHALELVRQANAHFKDPKGGWFLSDDSTAAPLGRRSETYDGVEPTGAAVLIADLRTLGTLTGDEALLEAADAALSSYAAAMRQHGTDMAGFLDAALLALGPYRDVVIVGSGDALPRAYDRLLPSFASAVVLPSSARARELESALPTLDGKHDEGGRALAYVCERGTCQAPTSDPATFERELRAGWLH